MEILNETRTHFFVAQIIAVLLGAAAAIVLVKFQDALLIVKALALFAIAYILTVRMYFTRKINALKRALATLYRTGCRSIPVVSGDICYGRFVQDGTGKIHFVKQYCHW